MKRYVRDKRSPKPKNEIVSKVMSANKAKNTKPELLLKQTLWDSGLKGYRLNYSKIPGKPDIAYIKYKLAIFVNGCYWHRCPTCNYSLPKHNASFWKSKFEKNITRDIQKKEQLEAAGWKVIVAWECEINKNMEKIFNEISAYIKNHLDRFS